jgi:hypothetical protein
MISEAQAVEFIDEMSRVTGVPIAFGLNVYYLEPEPGSAFSALIDPSSFDGYNETKLERYADGRGVRIDEVWNDWGRFLKVSKPSRSP